jgi:hypothetical protein
MERPPAQSHRIPGQPTRGSHLGVPVATDGVLTGHVAVRLPLTSATAAMELAESHTVYGKVILVP